MKHILQLVDSMDKKLASVYTTLAPILHLKRYLGNNATESAFKIK